MPGDYLCQRGILDPVTYKQRNDGFYQEYLNGTLDLQAYLAFSMEILAATPVAQLDEWHRDFMRACIEPIILPKALTLLQQHREAGDQLVIITATNRFVTAPIARRLGFACCWRPNAKRVMAAIPGVVPIYRVSVKAR